MGNLDTLRTRNHILVINTLKLNIMATTFKSNDSAIVAIQQMLQARCEQEPSFAIKMMNSEKSMEGCINYLCFEIQKAGLCMVDDRTVMNIVTHYWDEADLPEADKVNCNIVVSKPELSDEDKAELKAQAMAQYREEQLREIRRQQTAKAQTKTSAPKAGAEIETNQPSLFDL